MCINYTTVCVFGIEYSFDEANSFMSSKEDVSDDEIYLNEVWILGKYFIVANDGYYDVDQIYFGI